VENVFRRALPAIVTLVLASCAQPTTIANGSTAQTAETPPASSPAQYADAASAPAPVAMSSFSDKVGGRVLGGGKPITKSTVTLWAASENAPQQIAQSTTDSDGRFSMSADDSRPSNSVLYLTARGGIPTAAKTNTANSAIALLAVLGEHSPENVVANELTTVGSVWPAAQLFAGSELRANPLSLRIAAGNVPNLADVTTGGFGSAVQDPLNSTENTTLATLGTLANLLAGCVNEVQADACKSLFAATTATGSDAPADTLAATEAIALRPAAHPKLFGLLASFYPVPPPPSYPVRPAPYVPNLEHAPSAWTLALKFSGGGIDAPGKIAIDRDGNVWTGDNFIVGDQASWNIWNGNLSELAPNGRAISPITSGFTGGSIFGPGFGTAIDQMGRVWVSNNQPGASVSIFDKNGRPLSPPDGFNFNHQLGALQGVLVAPNGDVWILDSTKNQLILFPRGDLTKGRLVCKTVAGKASENPCKLFKAPFHLVMDAQNRIWVANALVPTVVRFSASNPADAVAFKTGGFFGKGVGIDSNGNVWVANTAGKGPNAAVAEVAKIVGDIEHPTLRDQLMHVFNYLFAHPELGSVSMLRPDGSLRGPFSGGGLSGAWAIAVDGNDNIFVSNFVGQSISDLCGVRTNTCPPGLKTGDPISPAGGFVGGGMDQLTDVAIDPAGNVWVADNWRDFNNRCFDKQPEALSTQCGGNGLTVFYGLAKPVRTPWIGLPHAS
jgi:sugar lactone lactonase YvrE